MIRKVIYLLVVFCCVLFLNAQAGQSDEDRAGTWEETIGQFETWDSKNTFPTNAVLFVGSSSIRMWPTADCFREIPVINRGFGGSHISDVNYFAERIVLRYEPEVIVFYAGDNDISGGKSAQRVLDDYKKFVEMVQEKLPLTRIIFVSIKPSGSRWSVWPVMKEANMMVKDFCNSDGRLFYFDAASPLLDDEGKPKDELFLDDRLHLNGEGYRLWTELLKPVIDNILKPD